MDDEIHLLTGAYALDALDEVERAAMERHLRDCPSCAIEVAELLETSSWLGAAAGSPPPPGLRDLVLTAARTTPQLAGSRPARSARRIRFSAAPRQALLAVAAAVALLAGAIGGTWFFQQSRIADERSRVVTAQSENARIQAVLTAPDARATASENARVGQFSAIYSPSRGTAVLTFGGLPDTGPNKTYQLWRMNGGTTPVSLGALKPGAHSGTVLVNGLTGNDGLAVSVEKPGGVLQPTPDTVYATILRV
jgi:anti-sigma-K factor RskA